MACFFIRLLGLLNLSVRLKTQKQPNCSVISYQFQDPPCVQVPPPETPKCSSVCECQDDFLLPLAFLVSSSTLEGT